MAVSCTWVDVVTVPAVTLKVTEFEPWGTVTVGGTATALLELDREIKMPPVGARPVSCTVAVPVSALNRRLGVTEKLPIRSGLKGETAISADAQTPEYEAVNTADVVDVTLPAVNVNVAEVWPGGIVTDDGT